LANSRNAILGELDAIEEGFVKPVLEKSYESKKSDIVS